MRNVVKRIDRLYFQLMMPNSSRKTLRAALEVSQELLRRIAKLGVISRNEVKSKKAATKVE